MDNFSSLQSDISSALVSGTRSVSQLTREDLAFHRSLDPTLSTSLDKQSGRLLDLASRLLGTAIANNGAVRPPSLKDVDGIEGNWRAVVDVVDSLLERADTALDEFTGAVKRLSPGAIEQAARTKSQPRSFMTASQVKAHVKKPQLLFENVPTNKEKGPFKPLLLSKPHSIVPLDTAPTSFGDETPSMYAHPYEVEIEQYQYPTSVYTLADPLPYKPFDSTTAAFVDTEDMLSEMLHELKAAKEIAVDLEHHDQRSYTGIVCLMQISTRDKDWIVDTLKPWRRKLQCLNEVFADPNIVKVLHGAFMDVVWLQRDLGLYLVGLFDTHNACRALGYSGGSLAFLLKHFVNVDAQKQYQMADWRVRPLPQELLDYARSDTHYLLYIFDCMRNELIEKSDFALPNHEGDKIWDVLQKSTETALKRYETPVYDSELGQGTNGWYKMLSRTPAHFSKEQFAVFRAVHQWRDEVAREQDDSINWVMPNHQIFSIARELPLNRTVLLGLAQPVTQTLKLRADELISVITRARQESKDAPEMMDVLNRVEPQKLKGATAIPTPSRSVTVSGMPTSSNDTLNSTLPLRSGKSSFWGMAFESSAHQKEPVSTIPDVSLSVLLPPVTAEVFAELPAPNAAQPLPGTTSVNEPGIPADDEEDQEFILSELNRKRKRAPPVPMADGMAAQNDEVTIVDELEERLAKQKIERKRAKKAAKRAKSQAANGNGDTLGSSDGQHGRKLDEEEPFDYASAPSILNPPRETKEEMKARKKKEVNPYAKALDTPKGLPRVQKETGGRSMTFK